MYLKKMCLKEKFWKKISFDLQEIIENNTFCVELIFKFRNVLQDFIISYDEKRDFDIAIKFGTTVDTCLKILFSSIPESVRSIRVPIYLFKNADLVVTDFNRFKNLETLNLMGSNGWKVSALNL